MRRGRRSILRCFDAAQVEAIGGGTDDQLVDAGARGQRRDVEDGRPQVFGLQHALALLPARRNRSLLQDRRCHLARQDRRRADAVGAFLHVDRLGERDHRALGGVVRGPGKRRGIAPGPRRDIDDQTGLARSHAGQHRETAVEEAVQIDPDHVVPALGRHGLEVSLAAADVGARARHQDVDAAVALLDVGRGTLHRRAVADVEQVGLRAAELLQFGQAAFIRARGASGADWGMEPGR